MAKVKVTVTHKQVVTFDAGEIHPNLVKGIVEQMERGGIEGGWSAGDLARGPGSSDHWEVTDIDVEKV